MTTVFLNSMLSACLQMPVHPVFHMTRSLCCVLTIFGLTVVAPGLGALSIDSYFHDGRARTMEARVSWDRSMPRDYVGTYMNGDHPSGIKWLEWNGGLAFLDIYRVEQGLRFETWHTDTNGNYSSDAIDIFTLPIDICGAFPPSLSGISFASPRGSNGFTILHLEDNAYGFRLLQGAQRVPDTAATLGLLVCGVCVLALMKFRRGR